MPDLTPETLAELQRLLDEARERLASPRRGGKAYAVNALRDAAVNALPALLDAAAERDALAAKLDAVRALAEHYAGLTNVDAGSAILRALDAETGGKS